MRFAHEDRVGQFMDDVVHDEVDLRNALHLIPPGRGTVGGVNGLLHERPSLAVARCPLDDVGERMHSPFLSGREGRGQREPHSPARKAH